MDILRSRGLAVVDEAQAKDFLLRNNYYRVSGYSLTLRKNDVFYEGATFQNIIDICLFDHELRHILLKYLETIEVQMKSIFACEFTKVHGPAGYLNKAFFTDTIKHKEIIGKADLLKKRQLPYEDYLKHFVNDLRQTIPLWAYVDLLTIADISFLYSISEPAVKNAVARAFGLTMKKGPDILGSYMHSMTIIRNLCAHGSRLFNWFFEQKPSLNKKEKVLLRKNSGGETDNAHLYGFLLVMKRILPAEKFSEMKNSLVLLTKKYPFVRMDYYGFRGDWQQSL